MRNKGLFNNMGKPKKRVSPRIASQVNRDFERLIFLCILDAVRATNAPWDSICRPCWDPRIVAVCVFMKWDEAGDNKDDREDYRIGYRYQVLSY